jgi:hypothetical protein
MVDTTSPSALSLSPKERDYAARTLISEFGEDVTGQAAGMHVIRNRLAKGGFGDTVQDIITKPYAFEPWLHAGTGRHNDPLAHDPRSPAYQRALQVVDAVASGQVPDLTHGATHFYAPAAQKQLAMSDNRQLVPDWATRDAHKLTLGGTEFYAPASDGKRVITITRGGEQPADVAPDWMQKAEERLTGGAAGGVSTQAPAPEWMLKAEERLAPKGVAPTELPMVEMEPPEGWGAGRSMLTGATLGAYPAMQAAGEALYEKATGPGPSLSTLVTGQPTTLSGIYEKKLADIQQEREQYQQYAPRTAMLSEMAGSLAGTAIPMGLAARGAKVGAELLGAAAPRIAPALEAAGQFISGRAGEGAKGFAGYATRAGSLGTQGAVQGAGQALLTRELQPEDQSLGAATGEGALIGAGANMLLGPMFSRLAAPLSAEVNPALERSALDANLKYDLGIRRSQLGSPELQKLDAQIVPQHLNDEQVAKFSDAVAKQVGIGEMTEAAVTAAMDRDGQLLENIAATTTLNVDRKFFNELSKIRKDVYDTTVKGNPARQKIDAVLKKIVNESQTFKMDGKKFRDFVRNDGVIANELLNAGDSKLRQAGGDIKSALLTQLSVTDPVAGHIYNAARENYRKLVALKPLANPTGIIDPTKLASRVSKSRLQGPLRELGEVGKHMPKVTAQGFAKPQARGGGPSDLFKYGIGGLAGLSVAHEGAPLMQQALEYIGGQPLYAAIPAAALAAGHKAGEGLLRAGMTSPMINRLAMEGRLPNVVTPGLNVLSRGGGAVGAQVGAGKGR